MLGKRLILWQVEYSDKAYTDQMGISHDGNVVKEEVSVTIVEDKKVPGDYSREEHKGFRAESSDGKSFVVNWSTYPECTNTPEYFWHPLPFPADRYIEYVDAVQAYNESRMLYVRDNQKARPNSDGYCEKHDKCFMINNPFDFHSSCWKCSVENFKRQN